MDHFSVLNLPRSFVLQPEKLEANYLEACRTHHPDFQHTPEKIQESLTQTARINQAYAVLKNPFTRGEYFIKLLGGPTGEEHRAVPVDFLEQVMEWKVGLPEMVLNPARKAQFAEELRKKLFFFEESLFKGFQKLESNKDEASKGELMALRVHLNCAKYIKNLQDELVSIQGA